jgi:hypothetical protein
MNRSMNNVLPLVFPRGRKTCWRRDLAKIIPLHPRRRPSHLSRAVTLLLGVVIVAVAVTACILILPSERELIRDLGPWLPLCWPPG